MPDIIIDPEFRSLLVPLTEEELTLLEESIVTEGCRDALVTWNSILLDGHNRYEICTRLGIPFQTAENTDVHSRAEAINWIINNQLGRRNITPEQASYLRGRRYQQEKRQDGGHGDQKSGYQNDTPNVAERLADEYKVGEATIKRDAQYADAVDALDEKVGKGTREAILKRDSPLTKQGIISAAQVVSDTEQLPILSNPNWKQYHALQALEQLGKLPEEERKEATDVIDKPGVPPHLAIEMLGNLAIKPEEERKEIYGLNKSEDSRERTLALTRAAEQPPAPDPRDILLSSILRKLRRCLTEFPHDPLNVYFQEEIEHLEALQEKIIHQWENRNGNGTRGK